MKQIKIGLLPLYIKLYDDCGSDRTYTQAFYNRMAGLLKNQGFEVIKNDYCRIKEEFKAAVTKFENEGADVIVTLHMAYSPSLESIDALCGTDLPIVVLDSTEAYGLNYLQSPNPISNNHGIHGVMDMCNLLKQRGKPYAIAAGHTSNSNVIKKTCDFIKAAYAAKSLNGSKVGAFGTSFDGMGDFLISKEDAKNIFGIEIVSFSDDDMNALAKKVTDKEIADEKAAYEKDFVNNLACGDAEVLDKAIKAALAVRKGVEEKGLDAFSVNFLDITKKNLDSMPFVEACKAMARGIGYAGEGDVLTASFVGALLKAFKETSFIEIFCPDWKKDKLLISHMGEMNYAVANAKPVLIRSPFIYTDATDAVKAVAEFKTGAAVFGNVYKDEDGKYKLLLSEIEMVEGEPGFESSIRGWFKANKPINEFLEELSEYGAIHHSFMVYGVDIKALEYFGKLVGFGVNKI
jgi:L-arabinose isomerase